MDLGLTYYLSNLMEQNYDYISDGDAVSEI